MLQLVRKSAFISLGLAAMSLTMLEEIGEKIAKEAKLSEAEGKKLVDDLVNQSQQSKEEITATLEKYVQDSLVKMNFATSKDMQSIDKRLEKIEKSLVKKPSSVKKT